MLFHTRTLVGLTIGWISVFALVQTIYAKNNTCEKLPEIQLIEDGTKIRIKGVLEKDAKEFSIDFVNEDCKNPKFITYHFKWILDEEVIVQNYKDNGSWIDHMEQNYDKLNGPDFGLEFAFKGGIIDVYRLYEGWPNHITSYEPFFHISDIKVLQVSDEVKKITEISFQYA